MGRPGASHSTLGAAVGAVACRWFAWRVVCGMAWHALLMHCTWPVLTPNARTHPITGSLMHIALHCYTRWFCSTSAPPLLVTSLRGFRKPLDESFTLARMFRGECGVVYSDRLLCYTTSVHAAVHVEPVAIARGCSHCCLVG